MKVQFDLAIIDQLGEKLYTQLPPILAEYISNSYDADANNVDVIIELTQPKDENNKESMNIYNITIKDDGSGIADNSQKIEDIFLSFGRKKRLKEGKRNSANYKRPYHGKKGVGKLAGFGCAEKIEIETTCNGMTNKFCLDHNEIQRKIEENNNEYCPAHDIVDKNSHKNSGTIITLYRVKRSTKIDINDLALSLAARLQVFNRNKSDNDHFICTLTCDEQKIELDNSMYYDFFLKDLEEEYSWTYEDVKDSLSDEEKAFFENNKIIIEINTSKTPLKRNNGLTIFCRKKLASEKEFFEERHNDHFHSYLYGKIDADFIDADDNKDFISTERVKINWDKVDPLFISGMEKIIKFTQNSWRDKRKEHLKQVIETFREEDDSKYKYLNPAEQKLCDDFLEQLAKNDNLSDEQIKQYSSYVEDMFEFTTFQSVTKEILDSEIDALDSIRYIQLWNLIEAKEYAKIASGRINALNVFEKMIQNQESEVKKIQPFLAEWPWLLDPSITNFKREISYEKALKEKYPNQELDDTEKNRRLDFYCVQDRTGEYVIIELKRPGILITKEILQQVLEYSHFIKGIIAKENKSKQSTVKTILVMEPKHIENKEPIYYAEDNGTQSMKEATIDDKKVILQTYSQLLCAAKEHNEQMIEIYKRFNPEK